MPTASRGRNAPLRPLKWYKKLATPTCRLEAGAFLIEGDKAVRQVINSHSDAIIEIVATGEPSPVYRNYDVRLVNDSQFRSICLTKTPQGIMAVVRLPRDTYTSRLPEKAGEKMLSIVVASVVALGGLGIIFAIGLAIANAKLAVKRNPLADEILEALPCANCGACGLAGCAAYAEALAAGSVPPDLCTPGGGITARKLAALLGLEASPIT